MNTGSITKQKIKPLGFNSNENKGVRFMNKIRPTQKNPAGRSTVAPQSFLPQKNTTQKNESWKGNNNINNTSKNNKTEENVLSQSMYPTLRPTHNAEQKKTNNLGPKYFLNSKENESKIGKEKVPSSINARASMYDFSNRNMLKKAHYQNANDLNNGNQRVGKNNAYDNFTDKRENNNNVRFNQNSSIEANSHISKNIKYNNGNTTTNNTNTTTNNNDNTNNINKGSTFPYKEGGMNKNSTIQNAEIFINTYCSPIKRKYEDPDKSNTNEERLTYEDLKTPNKRIAPRNYNADNINLEYSKNGNLDNGKHYNEPSNKKVNNFMNSTSGASDIKDIKNNKVVNNASGNMNSYNKVSTDNTPYGNTTNNSMSANNNIMSEKKLIESRNRNDSVINNSYLHSNSIKNSEDFNANSFNRNYTNYNLLKNSDGADLLNVHNAEISNKSYYINKNKNKNVSEFKEPFNIQNGGQGNLLNSLNNSLVKPAQRNFNHLADTLSENMVTRSYKLNSSNNVSSAAFDRLSDENYKSYMNRKADITGGDNILNNIHNSADTDSNLIKMSIEKNANKMNSNNSKTKIFRSADMSNEKISLMNSILDGSNGNLDTSSLKPSRIVSQSISEGKLINNNKESVQEKSARLKNKETTNNTTSKKVTVQELQELTKNRQFFNFETYEHNDKDILYFKNIISNFSKYNCSDQDMDLLYKNVMSLNAYALNFQFENDRIEKFHYLINTIKHHEKEAIELVENDLKRLNDTLHAQNKEYDTLCLKLQETESMFSEINDQTGEKKLKVCSEIDEKKNALRREYLKKKMSLDKDKYKLEKMKENNQLERKGSIFTGNRYKRRYKLLETIFRIKVLKNDGNILDILLMPPNVQKHMWQRIQIERGSINPAFRKYLWSYVESFSEVKRWREYFKNN